MKSISLFSGAFGLDIGLEMAGIKTVLAQDIDESCVKTLKANKINVFSGDLATLVDSQTKCSDFLKKAQIKKSELFLVAGGPPCQSFSTAGSRDGHNDDRGKLIFKFIEVIKYLRPRFFIFENVKGLLSIEGSTKNNVSFLSEIINAFEEIGYSTVNSVVDSVSYGAPQHRERLIIVGSRDGEAIFIPKPTHFKMHQDPEYRWKTLRNAIDPIKNLESECARFSPVRSKYLQKVPAGGNWRDLPITLQKEAMGGAWGNNGGRSAFFRRLDFDKPSPTLTTSPVQKATTLCHPEQTRPLSVREYMAVQGFPQTWKLEGSMADKYKQIGNAVPVALGKALGHMLVSVATDTYLVDSKRKDLFIKEISA